MKTFAERMTSNDPKALARFDAACKEVFNSTSGRVVLAYLMKGAHPLAHEAGMTDHQHGNCEVVTALWRGSQYRGFPVLTEPQPEQSHV